MAALPMALIGALAYLVGTATADAMKRTKTSTEAKDRPVAKTETTTKTETKTKSCDKCPPDCGELKPYPVKGWPPNSIAYQQRICGMPPAEPGYINEWEWNDVRFDGFKSQLCMLEETKANYDVFFDKDGSMKNPFVYFIFLRMINQATKQRAAIGANFNVSLTWYFQTPMTHAYMSKNLLSLAIVAQLLP